MSPEQSLKSIVSVSATVPENAFTASVLGTERAGSGVVIRDDGLVLTIGYLIAEAGDVTLGTADGRMVPGHVLAYDNVTGFGLIQPLGKLGLPALKLGSSGRAKPGDPVLVAGFGEKIESRIVAKQEFAGYWEYLLDEAIFTAPAHAVWGGTALIGMDGSLLGIGSLRLQMADGEGAKDINMFVPIDLLPPVLDDLVGKGKIDAEPRPWLGIYATDTESGVVAMNVDPRGPAAAAGLRQGDVIADVRDSAVDDLAGLYRSIWACGPAGVEIPLRIVRNKRDLWLRIKSADRSSFLRKPVLQ